MPQLPIPPPPKRPPVVELDGWSLFLRGEMRMPKPQLCGDIYAIAPDGLEVALAWESKGPPLRVLSGPMPGRHAVLQVLFPIPVMSEADIARNFLHVLPMLKQWYTSVAGV
jgi:hypothetical protein